MKMKKKNISLFLCAFFLITVLGACSKKLSDETTETQATTDTASVTEAAELEPMEISVAYWGIQSAFESNNAATDTIFNDLCKKFNVTIKPVDISWNDYQEKNKVWAASGTLPDVFVDALSTDNFGLYKTWAEQGIIKELTSDLSTYSNLNQLMNLDSVKALQIDGKYYMIPRGGDLTISLGNGSGMSRAIMYRKDWAADAGYTEAPTTYEEFVAMVKAMMVKHPNAVGISTNKADYLFTLALDLYPELSNPSTWVYDNNQWKPSYVSSKTVPFLSRVQTLYKDGILDPDFITQKDGDAVGNFTSGNSCVMFGATNFKGDVFMESNEAVSNLDDAIGFIKPFAAADGKSYVFTNTPFWSESYISATVDDAKTQRILMLLDYMYSHEYAKLAGNGIEGTDWEKTDEGNTSLLGDALLTDKYPITSVFGFLASWRGGFELSPDVVLSSNKSVAAFQKAFNSTATYEIENCSEVPINFNVMLMNNDKKNDISSLTTDFTTFLSNFIISSDDAQTAWERMIKDFNSKGLQEAIQSVTEQANAEGIEP